MLQVRKLDIGVSALLVALGVYVAWQGGAYGYLEAGVPAAGFFPLCIGVGLAGFAAVNLVNALRRAEVFSVIEAPELTRVAFCSLAMVAFVWLGGVIGMIASAFLLMFAIGAIFGPRTLGFYARLAIISAGMTAVLYFIFGIMLAVPLL